MEFIEGLNKSFLKLTDELKLSNLLQNDNYSDEDSYWNRIANLKVFETNMEDNGYHFLYEIQALSNQIHFGVLNCLLYKDIRSKQSGFPNQYNHRYTFMLESTIHCIYSFWNRVAGILNFYLHEPIKKRGIYISKVLERLQIDYSEIHKMESFIWLKDKINDFDKLQRNEFAHNNSLIMQDFFRNGDGENQINIDSIIEKLIYHNNLIANDIDIVADLFCYLEAYK